MFFMAPFLGEGLDNWHFYGYNIATWHLRWSSHDSENEDF